MAAPERYPLSDKIAEDDSKNVKFFILVATLHSGSKRFARKLVNRFLPTALALDNNSCEAGQ